MSKSVVRIAIAVLISLFLIAAAAPGVQARLESILRKDAISAESKDLGKASVGGRDRYYFQSDFAPSSHDCNSSDPSSDY